MARPNKGGLDYFPFDVDFATNAKVEAIMGEFGAKGVLLMIYLLSAVYQKGYYLQWNKLQQMQLVNRVSGSSPDMINQIVNRLIAYGTFDEELFNSAKVLTSLRIQNTYLDATKRRKQPKPTEYWINVDINHKLKGINDDINPQSKVKKSKVNETKKDSRPKRQKRVYDKDDDYFKLAQFLFENILKNDSDAKEPNFQTWADDMRKLVELDHRDKHEVSVIIKWCQQDPFWSSNILSAAKLREQFPKLVLRKKNAGKFSNQRLVHKETLPDWAKDKPKNVPTKQPKRKVSEAEKRAVQEKLAKFRQTAPTEEA